MTVLDLIEILQLNKENTIFTPLPPESYLEERSVFEVSFKKIIFYEGLTLPEFYNSRKKDFHDLIEYIQKNVESVYGNKRELLKYFSVFQLLIAIDTAAGHDTLSKRLSPLWTAGRRIPISKSSFSHLFYKRGIRCPFYGRIFKFPLTITLHSDRELQVDRINSFPSVFPVCSSYASPAAFTSSHPTIS